jgi:hypothetical protein
LVRVVKTYFANHLRFKKVLLAIWEIVKWLFVIWLLLPIRKTAAEGIYFPRIVFGILLFVLFGGKIFYDSIFESYKKSPQKKPIIDVLGMIGIITVIAIIVGATMVFIGYFIYTGFEQAVVETE